MFGKNSKLFSYENGTISFIMLGKKYQTVNNDWKSMEFFFLTFPIEGLGLAIKLLHIQINGKNVWNLYPDLGILPILPIPTNNLTIPYFALLSEAPIQSFPFPKTYVV